MNRWKTECGARMTLWPRGAEDHWVAARRGGNQLEANLSSPKSSQTNTAESAAAYRSGERGRAGGGMAGFEAPRNRATVSRFTTSDRAIRRLDQPLRANALKGVAGAHTEVVHWPSQT